MNINLQYISLYLIFSIFYNLTSPNSLSLKVFTVLQLCNILLPNFSKSMKEIVSVGTDTRKRARDVCGEGALVRHASVLRYQPTSLTLYLQSN